MLQLSETVIAMLSGSALLSTDMRVPGCVNRHSPFTSSACSMSRYSLSLPADALQSTSFITAVAINSFCFHFTYFIFALLVFHPLQDVVDDSAPCGVAEEGVFVVDDKTGTARWRKKPTL